MSIKLFWRFNLVLILLLFATTVFPLSSLSQDNQIVLSVAPPLWLANNFREDWFDRFEEEYTNVNIVISQEDLTNSIPSAASGIERHLDGVKQYTSTADILYVSSPGSPSVEAVQAGYFLDLGPLVESDANFSEAEWIPAAWSAFQWNNGLFGIPVASSVTILTYNRDAFDTVGLAYPDEKWTIDSFSDAIRRLSTLNDNSVVEPPGLIAFEAPLLIRALLQNSFYDATNPLLDIPNFTDPNLSTLVSQWSQLVSSGYVAQSIDSNFDVNQVPLSLSSLTLAATAVRNGDNWGATLLPGSVSGMRTHGFSVSGGTAYPELAYQLAMYMSTHPQIVNLFQRLPADIPSQWSQLQDVNIYTNAVRTAPEQLQPLFLQAIENALPPSELRHQDYFFKVLTEIAELGHESDGVLQELQTLSISNLESAAERRNTETIFVATPIPEPNLSADQIQIQFGISSFTSPLPNRRDWFRLAFEFAESHPRIGHVEIIELGSLIDHNRELDCYYTELNALPQLDLEQLLNLDPLINADSTFNPDDILPSVLNQVRVGDLIYGYPLAIRPVYMWYNRTDFDVANILEPQAQVWEVNAFIDALKRLDQNIEKEGSPLNVWATNNVHVLLLTAAFGATPFDYSVTPPEVDLTSSEVVLAIRQVLDLAKQGYVQYSPLVQSGTTFFNFDNPSLFVDPSGASDSGNYLTENNYRPVNFPQGNLYVPASYTLGAAFIDKTSIDPQGCYDWLRFIGSQPNLFVGAPVFRSKFDDFLEATYDPTIAQFYRSFGNTLQSEKLIVIPSLRPTERFGAEHVWLNRVFDRYVFDGANLEQELSIAEQYIHEYRECVGLDALLRVPQSTGQQPIILYGNCARQVDPTVYGN